MDNLVTQLKKLHLTIGTIESFTGGLLADALIAIPGASEVYHQGLVLYQLSSKAKWLGVEEVTLRKIELVSSALIQQLLTQGIKEKLGQIVIATTGNAGPTVQGKTNVGDAFIGVSNGQKQLIKAFHFHGDRQTIRHQGVNASLNLLETFLSTYYQIESK